MESVTNGAARPDVGELELTAPLPAVTAPRRGPLKAVVLVEHVADSTPPLDRLALACGHDVYAVHRRRTSHPEKSRCPKCVPGYVEPNAPDLSEVDEQPIDRLYREPAEVCDIAPHVRAGLTDFGLRVHGKRVVVTVSE